MKERQISKHTKKGDPVRGCFNGDVAPSQKLFKFESDYGTI